MHLRRRLRKQTSMARKIKRRRRRRRRRNHLLKEENLKAVAGHRALGRAPCAVQRRRQQQVRWQDWWLHRLQSSSSSSSSNNSSGSPPLGRCLQGWREPVIQPCRFSAEHQRAFCQSRASGLRRPSCPECGLALRPLRRPAVRTWRGRLWRRSHRGSRRSRQRTHHSSRIRAPRAMGRRWWGGAAAQRASSSGRLPRWEWAAPQCTRTTDAASSPSRAWWRARCSGRRPRSSRRRSAWRRAWRRLG